MGNKTWLVEMEFLAGAVAAATAHSFRWWAARLNAFKIQLISVIDDDQSIVEGIVRLIESVGYATMGCFSAEDFLTPAPAAPHGAADSGRAYAGDPTRHWGESASTMQMIRVSLFQ
jgi:hypothetical protein